MAELWDAVFCGVCSGYALFEYVPQRGHYYGLRARKKYLSSRTHVPGTQKNRLIETVLLSAQNTWWYTGIRTIKENIFTSLDNRITPLEYPLIE